MSRLVESEQQDAPDVELVKDLWENKILSNQQLQIHKHLLVRNTGLNQDIIENLFIQSINKDSYKNKMFNYHYSLEQMDNQIHKWRKGGDFGNYPSILISLKGEFPVVVTDLNLYKLLFEPKLKWYEYKYTIPHLIDKSVNYDKNHYYAAPYWSDPEKEIISRNPNIYNEEYKNKMDKNITFQDYYNALYLTYKYNYLFIQWWKIILEYTNTYLVQRKNDILKVVGILYDRQEKLYAKMKIIKNLSHRIKLDDLRYEMPTLFSSNINIEDTYDEEDDKYDKDLSTVKFLYQFVEDSFIKAYKQKNMEEFHKYTSAQQDLINHLIEQGKLAVVDNLKTKVSKFHDYKWEKEYVKRVGFSEEEIELRKLDNAEWKKVQMTNDIYREELGDIYLDEYTSRKINESILIIRKEAIDKVKELEKKKEEEAKENADELLRELEKEEKEGTKKKNKKKKKKKKNKKKNTEKQYNDDVLSDKWICPLCDYVNEPNSKICNQCGVERSDDEDDLLFEGEKEFSSLGDSTKKLMDNLKKPSTSPIIFDKKDESSRKIITSPITKPDDKQVKLLEIFSKSDHVSNKEFYNHELLGFRSPLIKNVEKKTIDLFWFNITIDTFLFELSNIINNLIINDLIDKPILLLEGGFASQIHSQGQYTTNDLDMTIFINEVVDEDHITSQLLDRDIQKNIFDKIGKRIDYFNSLFPEKTPKPKLVSGIGARELSYENENGENKTLIKLAIFKPDIWGKDKDGKTTRFSEGGPLAFCDIKFESMSNYKADNSNQFKDTMFYIETKEYIVKKLSFLIDKYKGTKNEYTHKIPSWSNQLEILTGKQQGGNREDIQQDIQHIRRNAEEIKKILVGLNI
tara:strand:+ start:2115 stop:4679 length:2565 start_codon:yes stop_codon:yes gene_type:complete